MRHRPDRIILGEIRGARSLRPTSASKHRTHVRTRKFGTNTTATPHS
ncbi:MAG: hypothetical protein DMG30_27570 [Acidobacteria bacterium]|nr:MAG: hypothetical protein DMG30_27570 [Acidobacteriota bacterium]